MNTPITSAITTRTFLKRLSLCAAGGCVLHELGLPAGVGYAAAPVSPDPFIEVTASAYAEATKLVAEFGRKQIENLPDPDQNPRELGFGVMSLLGLCGGVGFLSLPFAGAGLGGGVGIVLDGCTAGTDLFAGTAIGVMAGGGAGIAAGTGVFIGSLLLCIPVLLYVEEKYPYEKYRTGRPGGGGSSSGAAGISGIRAGSSPSQESVFVNLVASLPDSLVSLVRQWDKTPDLNEVARQWLKEVSFIRPSLEKLVWIKQHRRVSPGAPVAPDLLKDVTRVVEAVDDAMEDAWLAALGLGSVDIALTSGRLRVKTPPTLRQMGFPAEVSSPVEEFQLRTGGTGGLLDPWVRVRFQPGPFEIQWGRVCIVPSGKDKGLVRVAYDIKPNSRVGKAEFHYKWNGPVKEILEFEPRMGRGFKGSLYFDIDGLGIKFVKAQVDAFDLKVRLPRELESVADQLKDVVEELARDFTKAVEKSFGPALPWANVLDGHGRAAVQGLERRMKLNAQAHGLAQIERIEQVSASSGKLSVRVRGKALPQARPVLADSELQSRWQAFARSRQMRLAPRQPSGLRHPLSATN